MKINTLFFIWLFSFALLSGQTLTLTECVQIALKNKETVKSAVLDIQSAEAGKRSALSNVLPSLRLSGGWNESRFPGRDFTIDPVTGEPVGLPGTSISSLTTWSSGVGLNQVLYDGSGSWNRIAQAKENYRLAIQRDRQARINVIRDVYQTFYQLLKEQQLLKVIRLNLDLTEQQVELVRRQYELGAVKKTDLLKAEVRAGQAKVDLVNQESAVNNALFALRNAMGLIGSEQQFTIKETDLPLPELPDRKTAYELLRDNNPALQSAKIQLKQAEINYRIARGVRHPIVSANINYSASSEELSKFVQDFNESWRLNSSISFSLPLFTGFDVSGKIQQAQLTAMKQQYTYTTLRNDLIVQLEALMEVLRNYEEIISINEEVLAAAEEDLKLVQKRYSLGSATILEVLDSQVSLTRARSNLVTSRYDARVQEANYRAVLGILGQDIEE
ncbi:MAG: TolC family protein [FCB group bacterium]|nr:TolC family protein [FCB group bacterium]